MHGCVCVRLWVGDSVCACMRTRLECVYLSIVISCVNKCAYVCECQSVRVLNVFLVCNLRVRFEPISNGVATIGRMLKNIGLFCKRALQKRPIYCKRDIYVQRSLIIVATPYKILVCLAFFKLQIFLCIYFRNICLFSYASFCHKICVFSCAWHF